jgi:hypothetical protein
LAFRFETYGFVQTLRVLTIEVSSAGVILIQTKLHKSKVSCSFRVYRSAICAYGSARFANMAARFALVGQCNFGVLRCLFLFKNSIGVHNAFCACGIAICDFVANFGVLGTQRTIFFKREAKRSEAEHTRCTDSRFNKFLCRQIYIYLAQVTREPSVQRVCSASLHAKRKLSSEPTKLQN